MTGDVFSRGGRWPIDLRYQLRSTALASAVFPGNAHDGDQVSYLALASATGAVSDVEWTFVYNASAAYWYPQGALPLVAFVAGAFSSSATATWQDTLTPKITVPFAGDYTFDWSTLCAQSTSTVWPARSAAIQNGSVGPTVYASALVATNTDATIASFETAVSVTANTAVSIGAYTNDGTPAHTTWAQRALRVLPLRVR